MLIPIAIAINIILGQTVAAALKVPIYLDSIGTILVGVLAGPIAGALTGGLANLIWTYVLPAAVPLRLRGAVLHRRGRDRPAGRDRRPARASSGADRTRRRTELAIGARSWSSIVVAVIGFYGFLPFYTERQFTFFAATPRDRPARIRSSSSSAGSSPPCFIGAPRRPARAALRPARSRRGVRLRRRADLRDRVRDHLRADLAALVFGGVTGSGTDLLVAAFQQAGSDLQTAVLQQGLISDPIDKTLTFFIVFAIARRAQSRRFVARFPQGEQAARRWRGPSRSTIASAGAAQLSADAAALSPTTRRSSPASRRRPRSPYHRLNPLTKAVLATVESIGAFVARRLLGPLRSSSWPSCPARPLAGVARRLVRISLLLTLPIAISVVLVSVFTRAGDDRAVHDRAVRRDARGRRLRGPDARPAVRDLDVARPVRADDRRRARFVLDLERRGVSPRFAFVALATLEAVPAMVERAGDHRRARSGRAASTRRAASGARLRGVLPLVGPVILSSLTEVEERSLALEARAFGRPGERHLLWRMPDYDARSSRRGVALVLLAAAGRRLGWPASSRRALIGGRCCS